MPLYNPFSRRDEVTRANIISYQIFTVLSWLLALITTFYYTYHAPHMDSPHSDHPISHHHRHPRTTFGQSYAHPTPFTIRHEFVAIYWIALFIGQVGYVWHLFLDNAVCVKAACTVGPHFILFNLFHFAHVMLWTRGNFILSEIALAINFLQLTCLYFRHCLPHELRLGSNISSSPVPPSYVPLSTLKLIHIPAVSMPLVWTYFALFWNGSVMVHCHNALVCRILANIAIWGIIPFAGTFLFGYGDWTVGLETAFLTAGLGVGQFFIKMFALQWIFAFTIMAIVFLSTLTLMYPGRSRSGAAGERAPLLVGEDV